MTQYIVVQCDKVEITFVVIIQYLNGCSILLPVVEYYYMYICIYKGNNPNSSENMLTHIFQIVSCVL